jgi:inorganic pyrophosphatase
MENLLHIDKGKDFPRVVRAVVEVRPIGLLEMADERGVDSKLLSVPVKDPRTENIRDLNQVNRASLNEVRHFLETYKRITNVKGWVEKEKAYRYLEEAHLAYLAKFGRAKKYES